MNKYLLIGFATNMGGGQLYLANKVKYLREKGWNVYVVYSPYADRISFDPLKEFHQGSIYDIRFQPSLMSHKKRDIIINKVLHYIDYQREQDQVIVESHSPIYALWGELLAEKTCGKNFCFMINAVFPFDETREYYDFFNFKHFRGELAGTRKSSLPQLFGEYKKIDDTNNKYLSAVCTNSVEDDSSPFIFEKEKYSQVIGHVGRDKKPYVPAMVDEIVLYAHRNPAEQILLVMIGGQGESDVGKSIRKKVDKTENLDVMYTGYLFPIPRGLLLNLDIAIASSGSMRPPADNGIKTIAMFDHSPMPRGVVGYTVTDLRSTDYYYDSSIACLIDDVLNNGYCDNKEFINPYNPINMKGTFDQHMKAIQDSSGTYDYYDVIKIYPKHRLMRIYSRNFKHLINLRQIERMMILVRRFRSLPFIKRKVF